MADIWWFLGGVVDAMFHPDSAILVFRQGGFTDWQVAATIVVISSLAILVLYWINKKALPPFLFFLERKNNPIVKVLNLFLFSLVRKYRYPGLIAIYPGFPD